MSWFLCQARRSEKVLEEKEWEAGFGDISGVSTPSRILETRQGPQFVLKGHDQGPEIHVPMEQTSKLKGTTPLLDRWGNRPSKTT